MSAKPKYAPLRIEHFHAVGVETLKQTMEESQLDYSVCMGAFALHHGTRNGIPIVIAEHYDQKADELSGIWFDESAGAAK